MTLLESLNELLLTDGLFAWIGLIFIFLMLLLVTKVAKYAVAVTLPASVLMSLLYLDAGLGWHFILMNIGAIFLLLTSPITGRDKS